MSSLDLTDLRLFVYRSFVEVGRAPSIAETAVECGASPDQVRAGFRTLAEGHLLVIDPATDEVWMAMPFSAVPTAYEVQEGIRRWWAN